MQYALACTLCLSAPSQKLGMFDERSSFLSTVLYVNLLSTAWLLGFFFFFFQLFALALSWCTIPQGSGMYCVLLASKDRAKKKKKTHKGGGRGSGGETKRERALTAVQPHLFAGAAVKWRYFQRPHLSISVHGYYSCVYHVNLQHLVFLRLLIK